MKGGKGKGKRWKKEDIEGRKKEGREIDYESVYGRKGL